MPWAAAISLLSIKTLAQQLRRIGAASACHHKKVFWISLDQQIRLYHHLPTFHNFFLKSIPRNHLGTTYLLALSHPGTVKLEDTCFWSITSPARFTTEISLPLSETIEFLTAFWINLAASALAASAAAAAPVSAIEREARGQVRKRWSEEAGIICSRPGWLDGSFHIRVQVLTACSKQKSSKRFSFVHALIELYSFISAIQRVVLLLLDHISSRTSLVGVSDDFVYVIFMQCFRIKLMQSCC